MGARQAGEEEYVDARLQDCDIYARRFATEVAEAAQLAFSAQEAILQLPSLGPAIRSDGLILEEILPAETLAGLYRMGVRRSYVSEELQPRGDDFQFLERDLRQGCFEALGAVGEADGAYAAEIEQQLEVQSLWSPDDET